MKTYRRDNYAVAVLALVVAAIGGVAAATGTIRTVAGTGDSGFQGDGGDALNAQLSFPSGVWSDAGGDIYIADTFNNRIRKISQTTGTIETIAGNGTAGFGGDGGQAISASLNQPNGICVDSAGNLYVADTNNNRIRKVAAGSGIISTVAGDGTAGFGGDGGLAAAAQINLPGSVFVGATGDIFIADSKNSRIRKVNAGDRKISTVAGTGATPFNGDGIPASTAQIIDPRGIAVDGSGNIYIADGPSRRIRKVDAATGLISTVAGTGSTTFNGDGILATTASISYGGAVFVDSSRNIYLTGAGRIRKVDAATGLISTLAGDGVNGYSGDGDLATNAEVFKPNAVYVNADGSILIADSGNNRIREIAEFPQMDKGKIIIYGNLIDLSKNARARIFVKGTARKKVALAVYDRSGRRVARLDEVTLDSLGNGSVYFTGLSDSGNRLFSGIYFVIASGNVSGRAPVIIRGAGK